MSKNNLALLESRLVNNRWLIKPDVHANLLNQIKAFNSIEIKCETNSTKEPMAYNDKAYHAIIQVNGILAKGVSEWDEMFGLIDVDGVSEQIDSAANDPLAKDIILAFASPGGETTGIEELGRKILSIDKEKPIYGWTETQMDSAAYWLGSQTRCLGMTPSSQCGGVGVYMILSDVTKNLADNGIQIIPIYSGKNKLLGHDFITLTDEQKNLLQNEVNKQHDEFKSIVKAKRKDIKDDYLEGLSYGGNDALDKGFVDVLADNISEFINYIGEN